MLERAYRVGKTSTNQKTREIIVKFNNQSDRDEVFRNRRHMKGSEVFINEDFCLGTMKIRRQQMQQYHDARRAGKFVYFNYRTLVIKPSYQPRQQSRNSNSNNPSSQNNTTLLSHPTDSNHPDPAAPSRNDGENDTRDENAGVGATARAATPSLNDTNADSRMTLRS